MMNNIQCFGGTPGILGARYVNFGGRSVAMRAYEISEEGGSRISSESSRTKKLTTKGNVFCFQNPQKSFS